MSKVFDEVTKSWSDLDNFLIRGIVYIDENYIELGYFGEDAETVNAIYKEHTYTVLLTPENEKFIHFNRVNGYYYVFLDKINFKDNYAFGRGSFPYTFERHYSTRYLEKYFEKLIQNNELIDFKYINELPYTFGLEFETSAGYVPELVTKRNGLIPLRDGSLKGLEYSTIVLEGNKGFNILKNQIDVLKEYTIFDKDCSLHVHFGNFDLSPDVLLKINNIFVNSDIKYYVPALAFNTTLFKTNKEKNYCEFNTMFESFEEMYYINTGKRYFGNLFQPHPSDIHGQAKWHIKQRYKAVNFINALCYNFAKTIEFRFLHPSYNFDRIMCWIFVLAAFIKCAEKHKNENTKLYYNVEKIVSDVYSEELASIIINALRLQSKVIIAQNDVGDNYGYRNDIEDNIMSYKNLSVNKFFY